MKPKRTFTLFALNRTWPGLIISRAAKAWLTRIWTVPKLNSILDKLFSP